jgi:hypothetical protein
MKELVMQYAKEVIRIFDQFSHDADELQGAMYNLVVECSGLTKKDVLNSEDLAQVFSHRTRGIDRQRMIGWVQAHTPIRPKFKGNGVFEKMGWSDTFVKQRKSEGLPTFDLEGARADHWADYEPVSTTRTPKGNLDKALKTLALEVARCGFEVSNVGATVDAATHKVQENLMAMVIEVMQSEKFATWADKRKAEIDQAKREQEQMLASKSQEVIAMVERAREYAKAA